MKDRVEVNGITLTREQVEKALVELNAPPDPFGELHLRTVYYRLSKKKGVILTVGKAPYGVLVAHYGHAGWLKSSENFPIVVVYEDGGVNGYPDLASLYLAHNLV